LPISKVGRADSVVVVGLHGVVRDQETTKNDRYSPLQKDKPIESKEKACTGGIRVEGTVRRMGCFAQRRRWKTGARDERGGRFARRGVTFTVRAVSWKHFIDGTQRVWTHGLYSGISSEAMETNQECQAPRTLGGFCFFSSLHIGRGELAPLREP